MIWGATIGRIKGDTWNLDYGSYGSGFRVGSSLGPRLRV